MPKKEDIVTEISSSLDPETGLSNLNLPGDSVNETEEIEGPPSSRWRAFKDSFKRREEPEIDPNMTQLEKAIARTSKAPLERYLKSRHLQMIAIGGSIGTGLFVGSGSVLKTGGPAGLLIGYVLIGTMIYCTVQALGELAVQFPISGSFSTYSTRFIEPSWGFAVGWIYCILWLVGLPTELVAASITIQYWNSDINTVAWVAIFYVFIVSINFFGVRGYGEAEYVFSILKVLAVVGFDILSIVLICGGGPKGGYIGGKYWHNPGAFAAGFKGVCSVFVSAAYSFSGSELVGLAAAESANPRKYVPRATKQVFWRITLFYVISLALVGLLVPYTNENLGVSSYTASSSPFVIAIQQHGISGLPSLMNVVIMISVLSVGNSSVYATSRTLTALADQGMAPSIFSYIDRAGRPLWSIIVVSLFGLICFVAASSKQADVFNWLYALGGLGTIITWGSVCFAHLRFRYAMKVQGRSLDELAFVAQSGVIGSIYGVALNALILIAQFWVALFPIGEKPDAGVFFESYLAAPIMIGAYILHKLWRREWRLYIKGRDIDLDSGMQDHDIEGIKRKNLEERKRLAAKPLYYRFYRLLC